MLKRLLWLLLTACALALLLSLMVVCERPPERPPEKVELTRAAITPASAERKAQTQAETPKREENIIVRARTVSAPEGDANGLPLRAGGYREAAYMAFHYEDEAG